MILIESNNRLVIVQDGRRYCMPFGYSYENDQVKIWSLDDSSILFQKPLTDVLKQDESPFSDIAELEIFLIPLLGFNTAPGGSGAIDYSSVEQLTGIKWLDGSDIYQITFEQELTSGNSIVVGVDATMIINIEGFCVYANLQRSLTFEVIWTYFINPKELLIESIAPYDLTTVNMTVWYIK
jgi:hypothetical protein